jgi:hypothetical protein
MEAGANRVRLRIIQKGANETKTNRAYFLIRTGAESMALVPFTPTHLLERLARVTSLSLEGYVLLLLLSYHCGLNLLW